MKKSIIKLLNSPFLQGMGSIFNIFGDNTPVKVGGFADDIEALRGDWQKIGNDMRKAMAKYGKEVKPC